VSGGETNYYDALRAVLDVGDRPDSSSEFDDTPDTITFLTDGMPTRGDITDSKTILSWYTYLNRYSRVTTHVVAFGDKGLEVELLRALAEKNFGTFVHVHGKDD
jgi:Mg-chelatase subunit ChlD